MFFFCPLCKKWQKSDFKHLQASNAFLKYLMGPDTKMLFEFVQEMPQSLLTTADFPIASLVGPLFYTWVVLQLFPVSHF